MTKLDANDFFLNQQNQPRSVMKQNQFGGSLGAPIIKDKFFIFGSYQGTRQVNGFERRLTFIELHYPRLPMDRFRCDIGAGVLRTGGGERWNGSGLRRFQYQYRGAQSFEHQNPQRDVSHSHTANDHEQTGVFGIQSSRAIHGRSIPHQRRLCHIRPNIGWPNVYFYARAPQNVPFSQCFFSHSVHAWFRSRRAVQQPCCFAKTYLALIQRISQ